jgi:predicted RNA binding protein YcfA (HicA-like mRNA interferase family)
VISILKRRGFALDRQSGSHAVFIHPDGRRTTVPIHGKRDLGKGILRQIMKDAGFTFDDMMKG